MKTFHLQNPIFAENMGRTDQRMDITTYRDAFKNVFFDDVIQENVENRHQQSMIKGVTGTAS